MTSFNMESLINAPPCFPSEKPPCIDLILTNKTIKPFASNKGLNTKKLMLIEKK